MVWPLYDLLATLATPLSLPFFALHPRLRGGVRQRLGLLRRAPRGAVWFHGASAGDVNALLPIAAAWHAAGGRSSASALTRSGVAFLSRVAPPELFSFQAPLDVSLVLRRVFAQLAPRALVLEHLELWPGLWRMARRAGVPLVLVNARLSAVSARRYACLPALFGPPLRSLAMVAAASEEDAQRFADLGVKGDRIWVAEQSTKHAVFHTSSDRSQRAACVVLGSVHPREEALLFPALPRIVGEGTRVIVAPRHPHRAKALLRRMGQMGLVGTLASQRAEGGEGRTVEVLDRIGDLPAAYERATVAFVGGSLERRGGHNVLEAARAGCAVVTGPHIESCAREMVELVRVGAGARAADANAVVHCLREWSAYDACRSAACQQAADKVGLEARMVMERVVRWLKERI